MVKHIVLWNIIEGLDKEETILNLRKKLTALVGQVPTLRKLEIGANYNDKPSGHDVCLYTEFDDAAGLAAYIVHPLHKEVGLYVKRVVCDRADSDYVI
ncbi:MAG: Dabb family protein [Vallitaleaceae bacterium]|jgi:hypothetical protein|nr:Dabb family protein [Vallitaleaceae bacterium]